MGQDSTSGCPFLVLIQGGEHLLRSTYIIRGGLPKETVPFLVGGRCPVLCGKCGVELVCVLFGPVIQLQHHSSAGQSRLSSICHQRGTIVLYRGEGCDSEPFPTTNLLLLLINGVCTTQNNRKGP